MPICMKWILYVYSAAFCRVSFGNAKYAVVPHYSLDSWFCGTVCSHDCVLLHASSTCSVVSVGVIVVSFVKKADPK